MEAVTLVKLLIEKCGDEIIEELIYVIKDISAKNVRLHDYKEILADAERTAVGYASSIGFTGNGYIQAIEFLAEKAGVKVLPF